MRNSFAAVLAVACLLVAACTGGGSDVRTIRIEAADSGCEPTSFDVNPEQRLRIVLANDADTAYVLTDPEGIVPVVEAAPGEEAEQFAELPAGAATYALRCTAEGGAETQVLIRAGDVTEDGATPDPSVASDQPTALPDDPDTTLAVSLGDYTVTLSEEAIETGRVMFIATNVSAGQSHELNILQLQEDGSFQNEGGIAPMAPQQGGSVLANLRAGTYRIACLIEIGEQGSTVDHYQQGMWTDLVVE